MALFFIAVATLSVKSGFGFTEWGIFAEKSTNLALQRGVKATCDSVEVAELSAEKAIDGDDESLYSRWSSENNWEDASHYIQL